MSVAGILIALIASPQGHAPFTGSWSCSSDRGVASTMTFSISADKTWLVMQMRTGGVTYVDHYHRGVSGAWVTTQFGSDGSTYQGHSDGWAAAGNAQALTFEGVARTTDTQTHTREAWTTGRDGTMTRAWSDLNGTTWTTTGSTTCKRVR